MAKTVCKNCGHKNPSSASVCENCGNFLFEEPKPVSSGVSQTAPVVEQETQMQETEPGNMQAQPENTTSQQAPVTIKVSGGGILQQLSTLSGFAILGVFFVMEYMGFLLDAYYFVIFLALIFAVPTLLRKVGSVITFSGLNFSFRNSGSADMYPLTEVDNVKIDQYNRVDQTMTINFRDSRPPLQVEFNSIMAFRSVIVAFSRRRIPIIPAGPTSNTGNAGP